MAHWAHHAREALFLTKKSSVASMVISVVFFLFTLARDVEEAMGSPTSPASNSPCPAQHVPFTPITTENGSIVPSIYTFFDHFGRLGF